jgi:rubrerythrin
MDICADRGNVVEDVTGKVKASRVSGSNGEESENGPRNASEQDHLFDDPGEPRCAECGGLITQSDVVCPHCGISLAAG